MAPFLYFNVLWYNAFVHLIVVEPSRQFDSGREMAFMAGISSIVKLVQRGIQGFHVHSDSQDNICTKRVGGFFVEK